VKLTEPIKPAPSPPMMCREPGCKDAAVCRPVLLVRSKKRSPDGPRLGADVFHANVVGEEQYIIRYVVELQLCGKHRDRFDMRKYMGEATWSAIENHVRQNHMAPPDKDNWTVEWEASTDENGKIQEA